MTKKEILEVACHYRDKLSKWPSEECSMGFDQPGMGLQIKHACWMMDEMIRRLDSGEMDEFEAHHWLGFIQCVFWIHGLFLVHGIEPKGVWE